MKVAKAVSSTLEESRARNDYLELAKRRRHIWSDGFTVAYKFRALGGEGMDRVIDLIERSRVYFASPQEFNDPLDCSPVIRFAGDPNDPKFASEVAKDHQRLVEKSGLSVEDLEQLAAKSGVAMEEVPDAVMKTIRGDLQDNMRIYCLTTEQQHPLQWSHYADRHTGVCLHLRCGEDDLFGQARRIVYRPDRPPILIPQSYQSESDMMDSLVFMKADFWKYESEYRIVAYHGVEWGGILNGNFVSFDPALLVGITMGMRIQPAHRDQLVALARSHNPPLAIWDAIEDPDRFWINIRRAT
jgi:hypothetical protein